MLGIFTWDLPRRTRTIAFLRDLLNSANEQCLILTMRLGEAPEANQVCP
jgi:hypothetical protein